MLLENLQLSELRVMDCIDCHNRPSHNYQVLQNFIDEAISAGRISKDLPDIKFLAMEVLREDYPTKDSAFSAIAFQVKDYYEMQYPDMSETHKSSFDETIAAFQHGYSRNIFPEMKVKWSEYPNHLGHLETNGCYRCYNDRHVIKQNHVISRVCNLCNSILAQGRPGELPYSTSFESLEFEHPVDSLERKVLFRLPFSTLLVSFVMHLEMFMHKVINKFIYETTKFYSTIRCWVIGSRIFPLNYFR